jgi:hypothetical protein
MIPDELRNDPKLMRLHRHIAAQTRVWRGQTAAQAESLMIWIDHAIAERARGEQRRRRKTRKPRKPRKPTSDHRRKRHPTTPCQRRKDRNDHA